KSGARPSGMFTRLAKDIGGRATAGKPVDLLCRATSSASSVERKLEDPRLPVALEARHVQTTERLPERPVARRVARVGRDECAIEAAQQPLLLQVVEQVARLRV